ncbi:MULTISPECIES: HTH-type transcriptional regulator LysM [Sulfurisphaera]|uniref:HTH-type transcriptional regulator LysM n=3 Tax=Sulfurisphaera TaxID=69655 RepID=LYSM_SULTO|nr:MULTISPECIES: HTH-type transcriptional regulator LysM [Sulfurisphaera]Q976J7.1 RecName: Full=HTH-type transcriptional regulator LysM [Sulfurisphaera tokodaii str. 7]MBB5253267.1 Lrp/AsnC family transcriptional regulator of lysine biosynthesis [Sulfurisphaera ohwakuensis]QGR15829.1 winged helix-turn-helix transcriptional regulator [Sulfurisphaera ohwakuensis]BAB65150.1 transcriptional regulator LysM [Sulfurisphaera tokodaii str. 7]HII74311.1 Lrp/AsnC family transcriptional regulator [Sulfuri
MADVDESDLKILEILRKNARTPYTSIAKELKISEAAVRKRIEKLIKMGVIKRFTIDYELENEIRAIVMVKTNPQIPTPEISKKIIKIQGVEFVYETTGDYDILTVVRGTNISSINKTIDDIRSLQGVLSTNSTIVLRVWF